MNFKGDDSFDEKILDSRKKTLIATPSISHMAISKLIQQGYVNHLISQNVDGLHLKSGVPYDKITELHGNIFIETCQEWGTSYQRSYRTRIAEGRTHETNRKWDRSEWEGDLNDTLVLFGESIPRIKLENSLKIAHQSELWICIGSSLIVKPAISFPLIVKKNGGKLVIINMETTSFDKITDVRFGGNCDMALSHLMQELEVKVPDFVEKNSIKILNKGKYIEVEPVNLNHNKVKRIEFMSSYEKAETTTEVQPFKFEVTSQTDHWNLRVHFESLDRQPLEIEFHLQDLQQETNSVIAKFNSSQNIWTEVEILKP